MCRFCGGGRVAKGLGCDGAEEKPGKWLREKKVGLGLDGRSSGLGKEKGEKGGKNGTSSQRVSVKVLGLLAKHREGE